MSKISEQKALEEYPIKEEWVGNQYGGLEDINGLSREKYQEGYDQSMQDFMKKAEEFLYLQLNNGSIECGNIERLIEQFKKYIENESEI